MNKITIAGELTDLNTYVGAMNRNRYAGNQIKRDETYRVQLIAQSAMNSGACTTPDHEKPVRINYHWVTPNKRKDLDNVCFAKKFINDGLVAAGVLVDDSRKYVAGFTDSFSVDKENPRVEITFDYPQDIRLHKNTERV